MPASGRANVQNASVGNDWVFCKQITCISSYVPLVNTMRQVNLSQWPCYCSDRFFKIKGWVATLTPHSRSALFYSIVSINQQKLEQHEGQNENIMLALSTSSSPGTYMTLHCNKEFSRQYPPGTLILVVEHLELHDTYHYQAVYLTFMQISMGHSRACI